MSLVEQIQSGFGKVAETFKSKANKSDLAAGSANIPVYIDSDGKAHEVTNVAPSSHLHSGGDVILNGYKKANVVSSVVSTDDVSAAIGKIEKALDTKQNSSSLATVATSGSYSDLSNKPNTMTAATSSTAGTGGLVPAPAAGKQASFLRGDGTWVVPTNTKNTVGSTDTSSKIFLVGTTSQGANPTSYSHDTVYVDTDGCLYSDSKKVSVEGHTHNQYLTAHQSLTEYQKKTDNLDMGSM